MAKKVQCSIVISEIGGKITILAKIPDGADNSVAAALATALIEKSAEIMNDVLGETKRVETVVCQ